MLIKSTLFIVFVITTLSINLEILPSKLNCISFQGKKGRLQIEYVVSGVNDTQLQFNMTSGGKVILTAENTSDYANRTDLEDHREYQMCFSPLDGIKKVISLYYFYMEDPFQSLITKTQLKTVQVELEKAIVTLEKVHRNQQYQMERDQVHKGLLEQTEGKIKWTGIFKIVVLLGSALVQLFIMKSFFKDKTHAYSQV